VYFVCFYYKLQLNNHIVTLTNSDLLFVDGRFYLPRERSIRRIVSRYCITVYRLRSCQMSLDEVGISQAIQVKLHAGRTARIRGTRCCVLYGLLLFCRQQTVIWITADKWPHQTNCRQCRILLVVTCLNDGDIWWCRWRELLHRLRIDEVLGWKHLLLRICLTSDVRALMMMIVNSQQHINPLINLTLKLREFFILLMAAYTYSPFVYLLCLQIWKNNPNSTVRHACFH
jgi:hypothetical protein